MSDAMQQQQPQQSTPSSSSPSGITALTCAETEELAHDELDANEAEETASEDDSIGSLQDFVTDTIIPDTSPNPTVDIDPSNIVTGKRIRKPVRRYVDRHYFELILNDVPPEEVPIALGRTLTTQLATQGILAFAQAASQANNANGASQLISLQTSQPALDGNDEDVSMSSDESSQSSSEFEDDDDEDDDDEDDDDEDDDEDDDDDDEEYDDDDMSITSSEESDDS